VIENLKGAMVADDLDRLSEVQGAGEENLEGLQTIWYVSREVREHVIRRAEALQKRTPEAEYPRSGPGRVHKVEVTGHQAVPTARVGSYLNLRTFHIVSRVQL
jgi:hypothetical protein